MALFSVQINFEKSKLPNNILKDIQKIIAESTNEHVNNISGSLVDRVNLMWRGKTDPAFFITVQTVQNLNFALNQKCVSALTDYLTRASNIANDRIYIYFMEKVYSDVALDGSLLWQCM